MPYMVTFTINIPQMLAYIPYMDPMGTNNQQKYSMLEIYDWRVTFAREKIPMTP